MDPAISKEVDNGDVGGEQESADPHPSVKAGGSLRDKGQMSKGLDNALVALPLLKSLFFHPTSR